MEQQLILKKIESMENELNTLKTIILEKSRKNPVSIKGMLKGIKITEKDIEDARKSLFHKS